MAKDRYRTVHRLWSPWQWYLQCRRRRHWWEPLEVHRRCRGYQPHSRHWQSETYHPGFHHHSITFRQRPLLTPHICMPAAKLVPEFVPQFRECKGVKGRFTSVVSPSELRSSIGRESPSPRKPRLTRTRTGKKKALLFLFFGRQQACPSVTHKTTSVWLKSGYFLVKL